MILQSNMRQRSSLGILLMFPSLAGTEAAVEADGQEDALDEAAGAGYTAAYAKLANASVPERPVLSEIADPKQFAESSLNSFLSRVGQS